MEEKEKSVLRQLKEKDAPLMLEWMHDQNVAKWFMKDFSFATIDTCARFIADSLDNQNNRHFAVVDKKDTYMGTVSLKNIDRNIGAAEFAIAMRTVAMGSGLAGFAVNEILKIAKNEMKLAEVYWNVLKSNRRAIRFYEKNGFLRVERDEISVFKDEVKEKIKPEIFTNFFWFHVI